MVADWEAVEARVGALVGALVAALVGANVAVAGTAVGGALVGTTAEAWAGADVAEPRGALVRMALVWVGARVALGGWGLLAVGLAAVGEAGAGRVHAARRIRHRQMSRAGCLFMEDLSDRKNDPK